MPGVWPQSPLFADAVGAVKGDWNGFAVLHTAAARVGGLDLGLVPGEGGLDAAKMLTGTDVLFHAVVEIAGIVG